MRVMKIVLAGLLVMPAAAAVAQETGIHVRSVRVLATDPDALAAFYKHAFGMSETRIAANSPTLKEIVINSGSTPELAQKAAAAPIVIATRPRDAPAGAMASLILEVPDINKAIDLVKANGGTLMRGPARSGENLTYAFVKDPDGNQIEMVMSN
jgi:predicted enzyme related to lactoylglutathione lyase